MNDLIYFERAINLALVGHHKQSRNDEPYINHPLRVLNFYLLVSKPISSYVLDAGATAVLHDLIEDTKYNYTTLRLLGICNSQTDCDIKNSIELLTYDKKLFNFKLEYFTKILDSQNNIAILIKLLDAIDNSQWTALQAVSHVNWKRNRDYYRDNVELLYTKLKTLSHDNPYYYLNKVNTLMGVVRLAWHELDLISDQILAGTYSNTRDLNSYIYDSFEMMIE